MSSFEEAKAEALKLFAPSLPNDEIVPIVSKLPQLIKTLAATNPYKAIRYLRIEHSKQHIHVQEIEVYDQNGEKVTIANTAVSSSSTINRGDNCLIVDGNIAENKPWPNSCHTGNGEHEWVEIDLGSELSVSRIIIYNRPDSGQDRLINATLNCLDSAKKCAASKLALTSERKQCFGGMVTRGGLNLLHVVAACEFELLQKTEIVEALKSSLFGKAAMVQCDNDMHCTPLMYALEKSNDREFILSFVSEKSIRIPAIEDCYMTALHYAAKYNPEPEIVKKLIEMEKHENKKDVNNSRQEDSNKKLPMHYACESETCPLDSIKLLFDRYNETGLKNDSKNGGLDKFCSGARDDKGFINALPIHLAVMTDAREEDIYSNIIG
jgi:hypothetical protein